MGQTKNLPWAAPLTGTEIGEIEQGGAKKKLLLSDYPGSGGAASWGGITGNINDQADLLSLVAGATADGNTAFGWGNHAGLYSVLGHVHDAADITTGVLSVLRGGTGINTYTAGDLIYASSSSALSALNAGTNGHVLTMVSGSPAWAAAGASGWGLTGNSGTTAGTNYIGTSDNIDVVFKRNNVERYRLTSTLADYTTDARFGGAAGIGIYGASGTPYIIGLGTPGITLKDSSGNNRAQFSTSGIIFNPTSNTPTITLNNTSLIVGYTSGSIQQTYIHGYKVVNHLTPYFDIMARGDASSAGTYRNTSLRLNTNNDVTGIYGRIIISHNGSVKTGNVLIGHSVDNACAIVNIASTTQGFLPPQMTTTQKNAIASPSAGLLVFDITLGQMSYYNGTTWINF